ncbi:MAG: nitroreductase family protein [Clostridiales bacterium]|jgi:nitroreductase|nr:nitroreductase family protein [Clostridiales bacterium]
MKEEALQVLKERRSIRKFKPGQITQEELDAVLEAGTYAPTAGGKQTPIIVAAQDPETVAKLDEMNAAVINGGKGGASLHPYYGAPTILLVLEPEDAMVPDLDSASVACNLVNAAYAVGLGSCWIHRAKDMFASDEGKELLEKWGLPKTLKGVCSVALGYADEPLPTPFPRKVGYIVKV